jgi:hypothetical protein
VILFVQYEEEMEAVRNALEEANIPTSVVNGPSRSASKVIAEFKDPEEKKTVIVLNASAETSAGLNLQNANHVIFLSPLLRDQMYAYNADMAQAIGRARRERQPERKVHVYRIVALDTIDVDILENCERRSTPLTDQGVQNVVTKREAMQSSSGKSSRKAANEGKSGLEEKERTGLVCEGGRYSFQPLWWLGCYGTGRMTAPRQ